MSNDWKSCIVAACSQLQTCSLNRNFSISSTSSPQIQIHLLTHLLQNCRDRSPPGNPIPVSLTFPESLRPGCISCPHLFPFGSSRTAPQAFATHGNASIVANRVAASARPSSPTSPVKLWRSTGAKWTRAYSRPSIVEAMAPVGKDYIPPNRPSSPSFLTSDFLKQQVAKQRNNNYHSTSLRMVATSVNRTALHPGGVQYVYTPNLVVYPPHCR